MLSPLLLEALAAPARDEVAALPGLEERLSGLLAAARAAWPDIDVPADAFFHYVAERLPPGSDRLAVDAAELYLVCACGRGVPAALAAFEARYFPEVDRALARMGLARSDIDDVKQTLWRRLFVTEPGERPKIDDYAGRGDLRGLLRVAATRAAISLHRDSSRSTPADDLQDLPAFEPDPEVQVARARHAAEFKAAFEEAVAQLTSRERNLLRMQVIDRVPVERIAVFYGVHRATATRWLAEARKTVLAATQRILAERLRIGAPELASLVASIGSQLDLSLSRVLA